MAEKTLEEKVAEQVATIVSQKDAEWGTKMADALKTQTEEFEKQKAGIGDTAVKSFMEKLEVGIKRMGEYTQYVTFETEEARMEAMLKIAVMSDADFKAELEAQKIKKEVADKDKEIADLKAKLEATQNGGDGLPAGTEQIPGGDKTQTAEADWDAFSRG